MLTISAIIASHHIHITVSIFHRSHEATRPRGQQGFCLFQRGRLLLACSCFIIRHFCHDWPLYNCKSKKKTVARVHHAFVAPCLILLPATDICACAQMPYTTACACAMWPIRYNFSLSKSKSKLHFQNGGKNFTREATPPTGFRAIF